ncbi:20082_t:CDS:2, partial [Gigaspora rosea]
NSLRISGINLLTIIVMFLYLVFPSKTEMMENFKEIYNDIKEGSKEFYKKKKKYITEEIGELYKIKNICTTDDDQHSIKANDLVEISVKKDTQSLDYKKLNPDTIKKIAKI